MSSFPTQSSMAMPFPFSAHPSSGKATIKLALEGPEAEKDGPFVRIPVSPDAGPTLLETVRGRALDLWKMNHDDTNHIVEDAKIVLTYRDSENDLCYIFSDEDLQCALPLFPSSLRVFARVEFPKVEEQIPNIKNTSTQTSNGRSIGEIPVHKVVESVVGVLAAASVALQKHVKVNPPSSTASTAAPSSTSPGSSTQRVCGTSPTQKPVDGTKKISPETRPFIHGRHTCDGCLTTPIVGKRFHAVNLPDYDLCSACKENYKGDEIQFEEAQLERDVCLQERWSRRFSKFCKAKMQNKKAEKEERKHVKEEKKAERKQARQDARRATGGPPCATGAPPHGPPFGPPPHHQAGPPYQWGFHPGRRCGGARHWSHPNAEQQMDHALQEAIRQNMLAMQGQFEDGVSANTSEVSVKNDEIPKEGVTHVVHDNESGSSEGENDGKEEEFDISRDSPQNSEEFEIPPEAPVGAPPAPRPMEENEHQAVVIEKDVQKRSECSGNDRAREESFSEDAKGSGPVAEELGATLDLLANAINDVRDESVRDTLTKTINEEVHSDKVATEVTAVEGGATIVQGEEDKSEDDADSQTSWDVVSSEQMTSDEALARAAQVVGSALFESDLSKGESQQSVPVPNLVIGDDHSIPTTLPSVASESGSIQPVQAERWSLQLKQLHEMGFLDDARSVEILERFHAANLGSGEMEEVSVHRVVNEIVKDY